MEGDRKDRIKGEREEMIRLNRCHQSFYATFLFQYHWQDCRGQRRRKRERESKRDSLREREREESGMEENRMSSMSFILSLSFRQLVLPEKMTGHRDRTRNKGKREELVTMVGVSISDEYYDGRS